LLKEQSFFSCGKFLITSEYFVLDGAIGLALPTQQGQRLTVSTLDSETFSLQWNSYDANNHVWLSAVFLQQHFENEFTALENKEINTLLHILKQAKKLNATFLASPAIIEVNTYLDFPNNWGLGSSATLINNIANWAQVNPFLLLENTFGGSGYDIAVAQVQHVITFQRKNNIPFVEKINIKWTFTENLFFVHLNKKQNSREGIAHYKQMPIDKQAITLQLNEITQQLILADNLATFENLLNQHEALIANSLQLQEAKQLYFADYWGSIKSLGAWGGDFVLATSNRSIDETTKYFAEKGFVTVLKYSQIISN
jgi:mevalonate kinase